MNKQILITGCAGFIGSNLTDKLLDLDYSVVGIDNFDPFYNRTIKEENISAAAGKSNFYFNEGDIRDSEFIKKVFSSYEITHIVHLAAKAGVRPSISNPSEYFDVNVNGTLTLLQASVAANIRNIVFASSSSVYGNNKKIPYCEHDNVDFPISPYAGSKKSCELLTHIYHHLYKLNIINLRFFTVYGPRQRPDLAIHKFFNLLTEDKPLDMYGNGTTSRDYTYIDDTLNGIIGAINYLDNNSGVYETVNLGNHSPVKLSELISLIQDITGKNFKINQLPMQPGDVETTFADISLAEKLLGYHPAISIEKGLEKFYSWHLSKNKKVQL